MTKKHKAKKRSHNKAPSSAAKHVAVEHQAHLASSSATAEQNSGAVIELRKEELIARKHSVEAGQVQVDVEVTSREQTLEVPLRHDEVIIERQAIDRRPADGPIGDQSVAVTVPVSEEQVSVEKGSVVYEEVSLGKRQIHETKQVSGTVRKEVVDVSTEGDVHTDSSRVKGER